ncbi:MAG: T9SS type A sorting domain-containing protein, partial [Saprospiraceae bacterium]
CYYRLKLVDQNHTSYSKIISVEPSNTIHDTRIVDLTNNTFLIENISSPEIQNIRIFNLQGNSCTFDKPEQISNVSWIIKLNNLPNGIYIASLHNKDVSQKILISN